MTNHSARNRRITALARILLCCIPLLLCSGCMWLGPAVPVRVPTHTRDISGTNHEIDLSFLKTGSTTREEVASKLKLIDTGTKEPHLFWGRWESSGWAWAPMVAPYLGSRDWTPQNVLIAFDNTGTVKIWKVVRDKELLKELDFLQNTRSSPFDLSSSLHLNAKLPYGCRDLAAELVLLPDTLEYQASRSFQTARRNLSGVTLTAEVLPPTDPTVRPQAQPDPSHLWVKIHFARRTILGKSLTIGIDPEGLLVLHDYINAPKPAKKNDAAATRRRS